LITEAEIQNSLYREYGINKNHGWCCSNTYNYNWECDFISITRAGYVHEYEIKLSKSDFKADFRNKKLKHEIIGTGSRAPSHWENEIMNWPKQTGYSQGVKAQFVDGRKPCKRPNYFWYVCPQGLIDKDQIPEYAGLIYIDDWQKIIKKAPCLHRKKVDEKITGHIAYSLMVKYWDTRIYKK